VIEIIRDIQSHLEVLQQEHTLRAEAGFVARVRAMDWIEVHIIGRIETLCRGGSQAAELVVLKRQAEQLSCRLDSANRDLIRDLRAEIALGNYARADLKRRIYAFAEAAGDEQNRDGDGYDDLDVFVSALLQTGSAPRVRDPGEPGMVFYKPTPARIVLELIDKASLGEDDVFYDLGSGLGHVPMLVSLLTRARAKGIEVEAAYCAYGQRCARALNLSRVTFVNVDARDGDYTDGTAFFLYTPFRGKLLEEVLEKLRQESVSRAIRVCTYGPCTRQVSELAWLERTDGTDLGANGEHALAAFRSKLPGRHSRLRSAPGGAVDSA
jgi:hypothetical protein